MLSKPALSTLAAAISLALSTGLMAQNSSRSGQPSTSAVVAQRFSVFAPNATLTEGFDSVAGAPPCPVSWLCSNTSTPIGLTNWFQGNSMVFSAQAGAVPQSYIAANANSVAGASTISNWLISPIMQFGAGAQLRFWSRTAPAAAFADRLEIRASTGGANTGASSASIGDFSILLGTINPSLSIGAGTCATPAAAPNTGGYPITWCEYLLSNAQGIPSTGSGRIAFRYFVTNGGPAATNSDYIGIDTFSFVEGTAPPSGLVVTAAPNLQTSEAGTNVSFTVALSSMPSGTVNVAATSFDSSEGAVISGANLVFQTNNWNVAQTVVVVGVDDALVDGDIAYGISLNSSTGQNANVSIVNLDNDVAGLVITAAPNLQTSEAGANVSFTVALSAQPSGSVNVAASSFDSTEGQILSGANLSFNPGNWNVPQVVLVAGVDDILVDGDINYAVGLISNSAQGAFNGRSANVSIVNLDNDVANLVITAAPNLKTSEAGANVSFTVALSAQPSGSVNVAATSFDSTEGQVLSGANLSFNPGNWNVPQVILVAGVDDILVDGDINYAVGLVSSSAQGAFNGRSANVSVVNLDNDVANLVITAAPNLQTSEAGANVSFTVALSAQPSGSVNVAATSSDSTEGQVLSGANLSFGPSNWNVAQVIVVAGVDDVLDDGDISYLIALNASSSDSNFQGRNANVSLVNLDNDLTNTAVSVVNTDANPVRLDEVVTVSASVSEPLPGPDGIAPTGLVTVRASTGEQCTFVLPATGCNMPGFTSYGPRVITVSYAGDALHASSANSYNQRVVRRADLSVDTLSVPSAISAGMAIDYQSVIINFGPDPAPGTRFINPTPAGLLAPVWSCFAANGASCPIASGKGSLDQTITIPSGGSLLYIVSGTVATPVPEQIANMVQVIPATNAPSFVFDPDTNDLSDTEIDFANELFANGFENGAAPGAAGAEIATVDLNTANTGSLAMSPTANWTPKLNQGDGLNQGIWHGIWPIAKLTFNGVDRFNVDARFVGADLQVRISTRATNGIWQFGEWRAMPAKLWTLTWAVDAQGAAQLKVQADDAVVQAALTLQSN